MLFLNLNQPNSTVESRAEGKREAAEEDERNLPADVAVREENTSP